MEKTVIQTGDPGMQVVREHVYSAHHSLINWKSIFAGLFVTLIVYVALTALGAGIGGSSAANAIEEGRSSNALASGAGIWVGISVLVSLAVGGYFAARTSTFITGRVGAAQGLIIASLFFAFMVYGVGVTIGAAGKGLGNLVSALGMGAGDLATNPSVQSAVQKALGDVNLKSDPSVVAEGLATRLLRGDTDGARIYLAYQTGLSQSEVSARIETLQQEFNTTIRGVAANTAQAVSSAGWSLFWILALGIAAAVSGGALGSRANLRKPLADEQMPGQFQPYSAA